jgi:NitT/TauT family transport system ATP-binding protein
VAAPTAGIALGAVTMTYRLSRKKEVVALDRLSFSVAPGEFVALLGPSGCGKSTALRLVAGLARPSGGTVEVLGTDPRAVVAEHRLGVAFQGPALLPWSSVRDNVAAPFKLLGRRRDDERVEQLIELVGLSSVADLRPRQLSGGMRQRVSIARSLVLDPEVLLLDEPFGALDTVTRRRLNSELEAIWEEKAITTLMVTHSVDEALFLADRVIVMSGRPGRLVDEVAVPFPRPRRQDLLLTEEFHRLADRLTRSLIPDAEDERVA